jgi:hypothetical protein
MFRTKRISSVKSQLAVLIALAALAALVAAPASQAQTPTKQFSQKVALSGTTKSGKSFKGTYTIDRFTQARKGRYAGKMVAVGTVRGRSGGKRYAKGGVQIPAELTKPAAAAQIPPTPGACQILNLTLQPIDLNLLGLRVRTSRIDVRIEAIPGAGNLLGNLLCGITGILDPNNASLSQLSAALNAILALVPRQ